MTQMYHEPDAEMLWYIGLTQSTVGGGVRSSSATAYLEPALQRSNLDLMIENTVTRLISTKGANGQPSFTGVEFASGPSGALTDLW